jgi:hypothetical protein
MSKVSVTSLPFCRRLCIVFEQSEAFARGCALLKEWGVEP